MEISVSEIKLRAIVARLSGVFDAFAGRLRGKTLLAPLSAEADGAAKEWRLPAKTVPVLVTLSGLVQAEGETLGYVLKSDGFAWRVVFNVVPPAGARVLILLAPEG